MKDYSKLLHWRAMTPEHAAEFRDCLSFVLGEVRRVQSSIQVGQFPCEDEYAQLLERTFQAVRDLVVETHACFCHEDS